MNIYADRGNLLLLERRCAWRGIGFELTGSGLGDEVDPDAHDLFYLGGGQDRDQALCARDLATIKRDALHAAAERGAVLFGVCGGFQLLGHGYAFGDERLPGIGLVDLETVREDGPRLIGNVAIEVDLDGRRVLAGFEGVRGGRHGTVLGTYLHGPLLPKNAWFADWLTATALGVDPDGLPPLDDALEDAAHAAARRAAGI
jgi:CobQ-like glutamine amidotransferase family enzyme